MRFPPNWSMELLLCVSLFAAVVVLVFSIQAASRDATRLRNERAAPPLVEETALGR